MEILEQRLLLSSVPFDTPLTPNDLPGSLIFAADANGSLDTANETDTLDLSLDADQHVSILITPTDPSLAIQAAFKDQAGNPLITASGQPGAIVPLSPAAINAAETYSLELTNTEGTGPWDVSLFTNTAFDSDFTGSSNDDQANAQVIDGVTVSPLTGVDRVAVSGQANMDDDFYQVALTANEPASIILSGNLTIPDPQTLDTGGTGRTTTDAALGDFNQDGFTDIVAITEATAPGETNDITVHLGNGNGTFQDPITQQLDALPRTIAVGDLVGDTNLDIAIGYDGYDTTYGSLPHQRVTILMGNGNGTFTESDRQTVAGRPHALAIGDLDDDGDNDIATANLSFTGTDNRDNSTPIGPHGVSILLNDNDGTFTNQLELTANAGVIHDVTLVDIDGDNDLDLLTANVSPFTTDVAARSISV